MQNWICIYYYINSYDRVFHSDYDDILEKSGIHPEADFKPIKVENRITGHAKFWKLSYQAAFEFFKLCGWYF